MYIFTPADQREKLYDRMESLQAQSLKLYDAFKAIPLNDENLEKATRVLLDAFNSDKILSETWLEASQYDRLVNEKKYRARHAEALASYDAYHSSLILNPLLYKHFVQLKDLLENALIDDLPKREIGEVLGLFIKNMRKNGSHLDNHNRHRLMQISQELSALEQKFEENNLDAEQKTVFHCSKSDLQGLLPTHFDLLEKQGEQEDLYRINRKPLCRQLIMEYAENRSLREKYYLEIIKKAGPYDTLESDNLDIAKKILKLKDEKARLLGFSSYREYQVHDRFAKQGSNLDHFYQQFLQKIPKHALKEHKRLREFAYNKDHIDLQLWDIAYYSRLEQESLLNINEEEISMYFPVQFSLDYMLDFFSALYDLQLVLHDEESLWSPDVKRIDVYSPKEGSLRGSIYLDLFQRMGKMSGAWMADLRAGQEYETRETSAVFCICNAQSKEKFLLEELQTLYHEFGHALHATLSQKKLAVASGINDVPWDIIELPSILSEQWILREDNLKKMSRHLETNECFSALQIESILKKDHYGAGRFLLRQILFGLYDWEIHSHAQTQYGHVLELWSEINEKHGILTLLREDSFPLSFTHIFSGGYSAGYYSYLWAEVYVHQVYKKMCSIAAKESWAAAGKAFKEAFLSRGYADDLKERLELFLGEPLTIDPLMKHYGLSEGDFV